MDYKSEIASKLARFTQLDMDTVMNLLEVPPRSDMGDYAFPCFTLAKSMHKAPQMISAEIASDSSMGEKRISEVKSVGPNVNFFIVSEVAIKF